jgi:ribose 1,5-bisphosphokinase PhnN
VARAGGVKLGPTGVVAASSTTIAMRVDHEYAASSVFAVVVTGPPGAGKTTVLTALQNGLADDGIRHAAIEIEALSWAHPPLSDSEAFVHLAAIRDLYASRGYDLMLCGATITSAEYMEDLLAVLAADRSLVIRLDAEPEVLRPRIIEREPPSWSGLPHLLDAAEEIAAASRLLPNVDADFSTVEDSPLEIAKEIRVMHRAAMARPKKGA